MGFGSNPQTPDPTPEKTGIEDDSISTAQEAVPIPMLFGERKLAVKWISRVYNQRAQEAPLTKPGKK
jgi:hypothetical protein